MGIVRRQAINNSIFTYIGMAIGYVNVILLFPILLSQAEFGLTRMLASMAMIYAQLATLGSPRIIIRFFPFFNRNDSAMQNGLLPIALGISSLGFLIVSLLFILFKDLIMSGQDSELFQDYFMVIPLLAFLTFTSRIFENYLKALLHSNFTSFLNNVLIKLLWLASAIAYYFDLISLSQFVWVYCSVHAILIVLMLIYLARIGQLSFQLNRLYYRWRVLKNLIRYGSFSILDSTNVAIMNNIDKIMIGYLISDNLKSVAVYTVAAQLSSIIIIPSTSMNRVLIPLLSNYWRSKKFDKVKEVYHQSSLINMITTGVVFALVWGNIDGIMYYIQDDYATGVYALLFLMIGRVIGASFGLNGEIILISKHYWYNSVSGVILIALMILFNYIFIPSMGILGAALGTLLARMTYNFIRFVFLLIKEGYQPFDKRHLAVLSILAVGISLGYFIQLDTLHPLLEMVLKGAILLMIMGLPLYFFRISEDLSKMVDDILKRVRRLG